MIPSPLLAVLAGAAVAAAAQAPTITAQNDVPDWAAESTMQLSLSSAGGEVMPLDYTIMPSTQSLGLNQSEVARGSIKFEGIMIAADPDNYDLITGPGQIAYLSCDEKDDGRSATPNVMLLELMENKPKAIVLYSTVGNWCMLEGSELPYQSIFTMADAGDAMAAFEILNNTNEVDVIQVTITGNTTSDSSGNGSGSGGNNSAVAMSILYTITGLITLLFLIIICTGAIRAHRYPERYGPSSGHAGRPRQSRAKGLARAVLETIPIVKFGSPEPAKPDPDMELENASIEQRDRPVEQEPVRGGETPQGTTRSIPQATAAATGGATTSASGTVGNSNDEHLGCTICTEDFNLGEDVRVLPCNHKYHPGCIDPWLVNVSGTCPLCRHDLRPEHDEDEERSSADDALPPPLELDGQDSDSNSTNGPQRRRTSRLLDLNRLRNASVEERMQALRDYRREQRAHAAPEGSSELEVDARGRRAKLADKLRDKFKIRTSPQGGSGES
ncbi:hypothetical protein BN1723_014428 [Verticillium longisporum]|uniref:RING-type domain-containing protein n=1 Tax=Verticillium longisporum TaxID=100787 RepID=A0A0G4M986_VERLO|nr:Receptor y region like protein [Verticillium longisporum]CRK30839.1 hypothetical protein BN1723_014428 [Verticillium longisporum]